MGDRCVGAANATNAGRHRTWLWRVAAGSASLLALAGLSPADSLTLRSGAGEVTHHDIRIKDVRGGEVYFLTGTGLETHKPLAQVARIILSDDADFNAAEQAFADGQWDRAADVYRKLVRYTPRLWLKEWCSFRLLEAAGRSGRFDDAVAAYIEIVLKDPGAPAKLTLPQLPAADSAYLPSAITQLRQAMGRASQDEQKTAFLGLLMQLQQLRGDQVGYDQALEQLARIRPEDPAVQQAAIQKRRRAVRTALAEKQYQKVMQLVAEQAGQLIDPVDQIESLYLRAQAVEGLAAGAANTARDRWQDACLEYARVISLANELTAQGQTPGRADATLPPQVPQMAADAMLRLALIQQRLGEHAAARQLYQRLAEQYKDQPAAAEARKRLESAD